MILLRLAKLVLRATAKPVMPTDALLSKPALAKLPLSLMAKLCLQSATLAVLSAPTPTQDTVLTATKDMLSTMAFALHVNTPAKHVPTVTVHSVSLVMTMPSSPAISVRPAMPHHSVSLVPLPTSANAQPVLTASE